MVYHVLFSCSMTLTQTERGYPPAIEHIGKAIYIKNEMGKFLRHSFMVWQIKLRFRFLTGPCAFQQTQAIS